MKEGMPLRIVATGPVDAGATNILAPHGALVVASSGDEATLLPLMSQALGLIVRGGGVATDAMIAAAPNLRVIGRSGVGYDSVDIGAATARGIPVVYVPGMGARAVAEAAVTLILSLAKNLFWWDRQIRAGNWQARFHSQPEDVAGSVIGIVGLGNIGTLLAELLAPFHARLVAYDPLVKAEKAHRSHVELTSLESLLEISDFVSLHAPLTGETRGMVNRGALERMKQGAFLINLARGGLIENLDVLLEFLQNGKLAGAALDVFDPEPPDHRHPIFAQANVIVSPHALGMTAGTMRDIFASMASDMAAVLEGRTPRFVVNPEVFSRSTK
jgi:D-3-phosphoglycerate dehydrogenase / 2-oxoglutarate reductase